MSGGDVDDLIAFIRARLREREEAATLPCEQVHPTEDVHHPDGHPDMWVLRDVEAKRAIVELHSVDVSSSRRRESVCERDLENAPCETLRILASVWSDHEAYDER